MKWQTFKNTGCVKYNLTLRNMTEPTMFRHPARFTPHTVCLFTLDANDKSLEQEFTTKITSWPDDVPLMKLPPTHTHALPHCSCQRNKKRIIKWHISWARANGEINSSFVESEQAPTVVSFKQRCLFTGSR